MSEVQGKYLSREKKTIRAKGIFFCIYLCYSSRVRTIKIVRTERDRYVLLYTMVQMAETPFRITEKRKKDQGV